MFLPFGKLFLSMFPRYDTSRSLLSLILDSWFASGRLKPVVYDEVWSLEDTAEGLSALEKRKTWGKAVVRIKNEEEATTRAKL